MIITGEEFNNRSDFKLVEGFKEINEYDLYESNSKFPAYNEEDVFQTLNKMQDFDMEPLKDYKYQLYVRRYNQIDA